MRVCRDAETVLVDGDGDGDGDEQEMAADEHKTAGGLTGWLKKGLWQQRSWAGEAGRLMGPGRRRPGPWLCKASSIN
jgi:hypothetical protein